MAEHFHGLYRPLAVTEDGEEISLYDLQREDVAWTRIVGYEDEDLEAEIERMEPGNLVEADIRVEEGDSAFEFETMELVSDTRLYFVQTEGYSFVDRVEEWWEDREPGSNTVAAALQSDDSDDYAYEVQLQSQETEIEEGEFVETYEALLRGELLVEPIFDGEGTHYVPKARGIIVSNPKPKPFVEFYVFPEVGETFIEVWNAFYEHQDEEN